MANQINLYKSKYGRHFADYMYSTAKECLGELSYYSSPCMLPYNMSGCYSALTAVFKNHLFSLVQSNNQTPKAFFLMVAISFLLSDIFLSNI